MYKHFDSYNDVAFLLESNYAASLFFLVTNNVAYVLPIIEK